MGESQNSAAAGKPDVPQNIEKLAPVVKYERRQMRHAARRLALLKQEEEETAKHASAWEKRRDEWQVESNAFLESFLIHFRTLLQFLHPEKPKPGEVTAGPFLNRKKKEKLQAPTTYRQSINNRLAHISSARLQVDDTEKPWPISDMVEEMEAAWESFMEALSVNHPDRAAWFHDEAKQSRKAELGELRAAQSTTPAAFTVATTSMVASSTQSVPAAPLTLWASNPGGYA